MTWCGGVNVPDADEMYAEVGAHCLLDSPRVIDAGIILRETERPVRLSWVPAWVAAVDKALGRVVTNEAASEVLRILNDATDEDRRMAMMVIVMSTHPATTSWDEDNGRAVNLEALALSIRDGRRAA